MRNQAMQRKLNAGECIDVSKCVKTVDGQYCLENFTEDMDYCDAETEEWIFSIGQHIETGKIFAAKDNRFYQNAGYECLWLR